MKSHASFFVSVLLIIATGSSVLSSAYSAQTQPNVLWILTDDQRYDSIQAFNRILHDRDHSELGYVESPHVDRLAESGVTFINTYVHAQGCAPSRASMHYGRYPHHTGVYEFEYHNNNVPHWKPSLPECMQELGYQTMHVGKLGVRIRTLVNGRARKYQIYETDIDFKTMFSDGLTDWTKGDVSEVNGVTLPEGPVHCDWLFSPEETLELTGSGLNEIPGLDDHSRRIDEKYDLLRMYNDKKPRQYGGGEIIGGVSPQPAGETRDGTYTAELIRYLENPNQTLTVGSQTYEGVDPSRPVFAHIGYDFPHTPVLPPQSFRERFQDQQYVIPSFDENEYDTLPPQLQKLVTTNYSDHYSDAEKQQMVQDYYAFCAYGDSLIGKATEAFIDYSETQDQAWMIVYVCGDHGWKLNDHCAISKFSPWDMDSHNPIIIVSSDKQAFPAGQVVTDFTEFVDIMPTVLAAGGADLSEEQFDFLDGYDLGKVVSGESPPRPYVIGESHAVTGPRATIRTEEFMLSIKSRPTKQRGENVEWAMNADFEEIEPVLYHLPSDPAERCNLAFHEQYEQIALALKEKLLSIVIGDGRVEVDWGEKGTGTEAVISNFASDADNKVLHMPATTNYDVDMRRDGIYTRY
jgi:arylsulfatase A-like enzyme